MKTFLKVSLALSMILWGVSARANTAQAVETIQVNHTVSTTWKASTTTGVTGYNLYRGTKTGGPYTLLAGMPVNALDFLDETDAAGNVYFYVVTATIGTVESLFSNEATISIPTP